MLTTEQIKRASKIAMKGYHVPATWSEATWEYCKMMCRRTKEFVPNAIQNAASIKEAIKIAEKAARKK